MNGKRRRILAYSLTSFLLLWEVLRKRAVRTMRSSSIADSMILAVEDL